MVLKKAVLKCFGSNRIVIDSLKSLDARLRGVPLPPAITVGEQGRGGQIKAAPFGVNVAGHFKGEFGLGEAARSDVKCLESAGIDYALNNADAMLHSGGDETVKKGYSLDNPYRFNLVHVNLNVMPEFIRDRGAGYFSGRYNIASWVWETAVIPERFLGNFRFFDEVWTLSRYSMEILSRGSRFRLYLFRAQLTSTLRR